MYRFLQDNPSAQPPAPFTVSAVVRTHSTWRHLWPFQSRKALISFIVIYVVMVSPIALFVLRTDPSTLRLAMICAFVGGMYCGVYRCLPAKLTLTTRADACHTVEDLKGMIPKIGYRVADASEGGHIHYRHKWAGKLRGWATWDEQDLHMRWSGQQIDLLGPVAVIELLERRLCRQLGI